MYDGEQISFTDAFRARKIDLLIMVLCTQLCRRTLDVVEGDIRLQYKIELCKTGMVDGGSTSQTFSVSDKLDALRQYHADISSGTVTRRSSSVHPASAPKPFREKLADGSIVTSSIINSKIQLSVYSPPSPTRSLQERQWTVPLDHVVGTTENYGAAVDISQDLLIVYHNIRLTA